MRILMLASSFPKWPGETTAPFIEEIAAGAAARGHQVTLLAPYRPDLRRGNWCCVFVVPVGNKL